MRLFFTAILLNIFLVAVAQNKENTIKYLWQNEQNQIKALVEIVDVGNKKNADCIYFLSTVDTTYNSSTDSIFKIIQNTSIFSSIIKVSFYNFTDSNKLQLLTKEFVENILPDIYKKYPKPIATSVIAGVNEYAVAALNVSMNYSEKFSKTALFFQGHQPKIDGFKVPDLFYKNLKGKIFIYVNSEKIDIDGTAELADNIALKSSVVLYKYDADSNTTLQAVFFEAFKWLMADGNNYIIKSMD